LSGTQSDASRIQQWGLSLSPSNQSFGIALHEQVVGKQVVSTRPQPVPHLLLSVGDFPSPPCISHVSPLICLLCPLFYQSSIHTPAGSHRLLPSLANHRMCAESQAMIDECCENRGRSPVHDNALKAAGASRRLGSMAGCTTRPLSSSG
jgi:hypothetical protein